VFLNYIVSILSSPAGENKLYGTIPSELGLLTNLGDLSLGINLLTGTIPSELGSLQNLTYLNLSSNFLNGTVASQLGNLVNLNVLWFHSNDLTGNLDPIFCTGSRQVFNEPNGFVSDCTIPQIQCSCCTICYY
jgi:hypothetical protein